MLREDADTLVIARGPMPFLSGNKTMVGYISPLTGLPHYSAVGGRSFAELLNLARTPSCWLVRDVRKRTRWSPVVRPM